MFWSNWFTCGEMKPLLFCLCLKRFPVYYPFCVENTPLYAVGTSLPIHMHRHLLTANESVLLLFSYSLFVLCRGDVKVSHFCWRTCHFCLCSRPWSIRFLYLDSSSQSKLKGRAFCGICWRHQIMVNQFRAWHPFASWILLIFSDRWAQG